jgi:hypothetical protein
MSNFLAIATVTATLRAMLQNAAGVAVPGALVNVRRPDAPAQGGQEKAAVNLYLYQVVPNAAWRNTTLDQRIQDQPGPRSGTDRVVRRRQVPVNLHYLFSFYGNEQELEPQRLLGATLGVLEAQPWLDARTVRDLEGSIAYLNRADLAPDSYLDVQVTQIQGVRLAPIPLNLEELSKLWSVFFQVPYALSVAYEASVVLLDAGLGVPVKVVTGRRIGVTNLEAPDDREVGLPDQPAGGAPS